MLGHTAVVARLQGLIPIILLYIILSLFAPKNPH